VEKGTAAHNVFMLGQLDRDMHTGVTVSNIKVLVFHSNESTNQMQQLIIGLLFVV
jgi:hypothetical protein